MNPSLGILLADPSQLAIAVAVADKPEETALFLMDEAVRAAADPRLRALIEQGAEVTACATDLEARGLSLDDGGVRAGSQYEHAVMMRDAGRVIALCGVRIDDHRPRGSGAARVVAVRLTRPAHDRHTAQALRSAVGYAACLKVAVLVEPPARGLLAHADHPEPILRAIGTLRGLGHAIVGTAPGLPPPGITADIEVTW